MQRGNGAESGGAGIREGRMAESGAELEGRWGAAAMEKGREWFYIFFFFITSGFFAGGGCFVAGVIGAGGWGGGGGRGKIFFKRGAKLLT